MNLSMSQGHHNINSQKFINIAKCLKEISLNFGDWIQQRQSVQILMDFNSQLLLQSLMNKIANVVQETCTENSLSQSPSQQQEAQNFTKHNQVKKQHQLNNMKSAPTAGWIGFVDMMKILKWQEIQVFMKSSLTISNKDADEIIDIERFNRYLKIDKYTKKRHQLQHQSQRQSQITSHKRYLSNQQQLMTCQPSSHSQKIMLIHQPKISLNHIPSHQQHFSLKAIQQKRSESTTKQSIVIKKANEEDQNERFNKSNRAYQEKLYRLSQNTTQIADMFLELVKMQTQLMFKTKQIFKEQESLLETIFEEIDFFNNGYFGASQLKDFIQRYTKLSVATHNNDKQFQQKEESANQQNIQEFELTNCGQKQKYQNGITAVISAIKGSINNKAEKIFYEDLQDLLKQQEYVAVNTNDQHDNQNEDGKKAVNGPQKQHKTNFNNQKFVERQQESNLQNHSCLTKPVAEEKVVKGASRGVVAASYQRLPSCDRNDYFIKERSYYEVTEKEFEPNLQLKSQENVVAAYLATLNKANKPQQQLQRGTHSIILNQSSKNTLQNNHRLSHPQRPHPHQSSRTLDYDNSDNDYDNISRRISSCVREELSFSFQENLVKNHSRNQRYLNMIKSVSPTSKSARAVANTQREQRNNNSSSRLMFQKRAYLHNTLASCEANRTQFILNLQLLSDQYYRWHQAISVFLAENPTFSFIKGYNVIDQRECNSVTFQDFLQFLKDCQIDKTYVKVQLFFNKFSKASKSIVLSSLMKTMRFSDYMKIFKLKSLYSQIKKHNSENAQANSVQQIIKKWPDFMKTSYCNLLRIIIQLASQIEQLKKVVYSIFVQILQAHEKNSFEYIFRSGQSFLSSQQLENILGDKSKNFILQIANDNQINLQIMRKFLSTSSTFSQNYC